MRWSAATSIAAALILLVKQGHAAQCSTIEEDTDYYNNDIKSTQQTSADKCCDDCAKTTGCTVYVWNNFTQTCWLKSQPSNKATSPGARASRLVLTPATCSAVQKNVDLPGNDIGDPILADTYALCCTYCSVTKGCVAYAWSPADAYGPATCYLKSSKGKATSYKGSMAAYLTTPTTAPTTKAPTTTAATTAAPTTTASPTTTAATTAAPTTTAATTAAPTTTAATTAAPTTTAATTAAPTTTAATTAAPTTTASPTTTATTTAAPTTTAATTAAPTTTTATTAAPTTAAPTPSPTTATQCAAVQPNTDYYGNDMVTLQKDTIDACCAACISTPGCVVFVWVMRDVGTCLLKSGFGTPSTYTGAYASYPVVPTPAPTPSACPVVENDVDYPGNDINQTSRTNYLDCCTDCQDTPGCSLYLWSSGVCYLKSKKGTSNYYAGTKAGVLPVATPTTAAPTTTAPTTTQCAAVQPNTDYYGYDIVTLQKDTIDQCCAACISTSGCVVFVWVMRDVGTCILKSGFGTPSTFTGAYASYPIVPTPAPIPSACPVVENDVDYPGNDIYQTSRANYLDCCTDCQATPGCSLYLWSSGVCYLKSKKGTSKYYAGTKAGVLPVAAPTTALANLQFGVHGTFPLASLSYGYIPGSMWIPQTTLPVVTSQVESFIERNKAANNSHDSSPVPMFTLEADLGLIVYINVTSKGECAALTGAYANSFFTYLPSHLYCLMHQNTADTTLQVFTAPGQTMVFPQSLDDAYMSGSQANVATNALCLSACATKNNCVGVVYTASTQLCTFYQPKVSTFSDVSAGWVNPAAYYVDNGSIQYTKMLMASLPKAYVSSTMPSVTSADACATYANTKSSILFGYNSNTLSCDVYTPTSSTTKSLSFFNTPSAPVVLSGAFGSDVSGGSLTASTSLDCYKLCLPSQNNCFASVFDSTAKTCAYYQASFDVSSTLGWIIPKTLPTTMSTVNQVDFYITAHQDDHELFMAAPVYNSLKSSTTKAVFVYMSGGDAGQTDGWWQARETGTLAATKTWVNMFGVYSPVPKTETLLINGHHIVKVTIGNAIHYFLRLSETNLGYVLDQNMTEAPLDQPTEYYANAQAVKDMLKAIMVLEATKVAKATASYSEYLTDPSNDHYLHVATGRISAELLNSDPLFSSCVSQTTYFGYQHWLDAVNMKDPESTAQRSIWLNLAVGIYSQYKLQVWSGHAGALGRSYIGNSIVKSGACTF